jgi:glycosyltransferase involved in cell wall biosynthesis
MRVLHVQKIAGIGGSERHLLSLLPALSEAGMEVRMCVAASAQARRFTEALGARGIRLSVVRAGPDVNPLLVAALVREIRAFRPDLVHTHLIHADVHGQMAVALADVGRVSSMHSTPSFYRSPPYRTAARVTGRYALMTIAISEHVRRFIEELRLRPPGRVRVVPYGIDASAWPLPDSQRNRARAELALGRDDVAVGIAARLIPGKGHSLLLEAHAAAADHDPRLRLLVAGEGPLRADLERHAERVASGTVTFLGFVPDMRSFMSACDVIAFPTQPVLGEGFGLAALEAMAAGRPVVATSVASLPELVSSGESGFLVDPGAVEELAAKLVALAADAELRRDMGARGHERARTVFSLERMVEGTLAVYRDGLRAGAG